MLELYDYQADTVRLVYASLEMGQDPVAEVPTGGGKSLINATLCKDIVGWGGRVLCATHVRELIRQNRDELKELWPEARAGIYSAGLGRKETAQPIIFAGVQSVVPRSNASNVPALGRFDAIIVDEAHLVSPKDGTRYRTMIEHVRIGNPSARLIGLSATPMRLGQGYLHAGDDAMFTALVKSPLADMPRLMREGYLSPLRTKGGGFVADLSGVRTRGGEFLDEDLQDAFASDRVIEQAVNDSLDSGRGHWLVFCTGVDNATKVRDRMRERGVTAEMVLGTTSKEERDELTERFKAGEIRCMVSVGVLTTGFNARCVDLIVLLRATKSVSLYVQMAGRGTRTHPGKTDCLVLDYGGNVERHGPVDKPVVRPSGSSDGGGEAPAKKCPECNEIIHASIMQCPVCGYEFPPGGCLLEPVASNGRIMSTDVGGQANDPAPVVEWIEVDEIDYRVWPGKGGKPETVRVQYICGLNKVCEWICPGHTGFARKKAEQWWRARCKEPLPGDAYGTLSWIIEEGITEPTHIEVTTRTGERWPVVSGGRFDDPHKSSADLMPDVPDRVDDEMPF